MNIARPAGNRKLPPDAVLIADIRRGLTNSEIADRHGVSRQSLGIHVRRMGWRADAALSPGPTATPHKIVVRREVMVEGRDFDTRWIAISLPRIPTLHGHFQGA